MIVSNIHFCFYLVEILYEMDFQVYPQGGYDDENSSEYDKIKMF